MKTRLQFLDAETRAVSDCGDPLVIEVASHDLGWDGMLLEKGWSPHFYPTDIVTPYFYFALALEEDLHWSAKHEGELVVLKTEPGAVWVNPPWTSFTHKIDQACFFTILAVEADTFLGAHPDKPSLGRLQFLNNYNLEDAFLKNFIELFYLEAERKGPNGGRYVQSLLRTFAEYYVGNYSNYHTLADENPPSRIGEDQIETVRTFILSNLDEPLTIEDLAAEVNMSKFYFLKEFKKAAGKTPYQFLMEVKMTRATEWIEDRSLSLADLAIRLGFSDQSHFSRVFKTHFGDSPGNYRKRLAAG